MHLLELPIDDTRVALEGIIVDFSNLLVAELHLLPEVAQYEANIDGDEPENVGLLCRLIRFGIKLVAYFHQVHRYCLGIGVLQNEAIAILFQKLEELDGQPVLGLTNEETVLH